MTPPTSSPKKVLFLSLPNCVCVCEWWVCGFLVLVKKATKLICSKQIKKQINKKKTVKLGTRFDRFPKANSSLCQVYWIQAPWAFFSSKCCSGVATNFDRIFRDNNQRCFQLQKTPLTVTFRCRQDAVLLAILSDPRPKEDVLLAV